MTPDAAFVAALSRWLDATDIDRLELCGPGVSLALVRKGAAACEPAALVDVRALSPGIFLDRHPLTTRPFAAMGEEVAAGDDLGCLQVGALLLPVRAPSRGILAACPCAAGSLVGYGETLFRLQPLASAETP